MTLEVASATAAASAASPQKDLSGTEAAGAPPSDPTFDRLFGRDADGAPLWLRTEELLRVDDDVDADAADGIDGDDVGGTGNNASKKKKGAAASFDAEAYIAEAKKLVRSFFWY